MKDKLVNIIKKYWVIPISILLWYYPIMPLGMVTCAVIALSTGSEYISVFVSMIGIGVVSSIPIILKLKKSEKLKKSTKYVIISATILIFAFFTYYLMIVKM
ncbi:MAG: hypothetical protein IJW37_00140 [Lachnospiraceae bacterium]|nr:hypothetical protein [Lachnospiraceae bacterium]